MDDIWRFKRSDGFMTAYDTKIPCINQVRVRELGKPSEVVLTESLNPAPYMPSLFPNGTWECRSVSIIGDQNNYYLYPYFFATSANKMVEKWLLDGNGGYLRGSGEFVLDGGYGGHHPRIELGGAIVDSRTTWGCLNWWYNDPGWRDGMEWLKDRFDESMAAKKRVVWEVLD